jgi:streptomycin 6-kinase
MTDVDVHAVLLEREEENHNSSPLKRVGDKNAPTALLSGW